MTALLEEIKEITSDPLMSKSQVFRQVKRYLGINSQTAPSFLEFMRRVPKSRAYGSKPRYKLSDVVTELKRDSDIEPSKEEYTSLKNRLKKQKNKIQEVGVSTIAILLEERDVLVIQNFQKGFNSFLRTHNAEFKEGIVLFSV